VILAALARGGSGEHRYAPDTDAAVAEFAGLVDDLLGKSVTGALLRIHPQQVLVDGIDRRARRAAELGRRPARSWSTSATSTAARSAACSSGSTSPRSPSSARPPSRTSS
jgi:hypothetical protein